MKKALLALSLSLSFSAFANTITFYGEVSDSTCNVSINGNSGDLSIQLPTVTAASLDTAGKTAGEKEFKFDVTGCSSSTQTSVGIRLVAPSIESGSLKNIASTNPAQNVAVQLIDNSTAINFSAGEYQTARQAFASSLTFPFKARYYAIDAATVGKVEAKVEYALSYN